MMNYSHIALSDRKTPAAFVWPAQSYPGGFIRFEKAADWLAFVEGFSIDPRIPEVVQAKFARAQTLYLLGWVDSGLVKAGELAALIALELAVTDRYGLRISTKKPSFSALLKYMVYSDGLTEAKIPMAARYGGSVLGQLTGDTHPTLAERRNSLAHGDPFDGLPTEGLLEFVRDLINFAYREHIAEAASHDIKQGDV